MPLVADAGDSREEPVEVEGEVVAEVRRLPIAPEGSLALDRPRPASLPATVAAAAGGFVLGVVTFVLVRVLRRPSAGRSLARRRRGIASRRGAEIASTRSFLVDVHLLKR